MKRMRRMLQLLRMMPPVIAAATPGIGPRLARGRWPRTRGTLAAPGLNGPVELIRDTWGVPHIFAKDEHDLFFAQGYVQAQDRLWQMEMGHRIANGTLAGMLGAAAVPVDRVIPHPGTAAGRRARLGPGPGGTRAPSRRPMPRA